MKSRMYWNPQTATAVATEVGMNRLRKAAQILSNQTKTNLRQVIRHSISRPMYQSGKNAGMWWTARIAGELLHSVRVVEKFDNTNRNVRVIVGHKAAYYATMFERAATPKRGVKFFRPAIAVSKPKMIAVIEKGE